MKNISNIFPALLYFLFTICFLSFAEKCFVCRYVLQILNVYRRVSTAKALLWKRPITKEYTTNSLKAI